jgi:DHA1 family bicyclomycin/chloramphenicol resistance-like MFS transporter
LTLPPLYRRGVILGLVIAVGAFAIDMYIPSFAAIARDLRTDPGRVQLSMTAYFLALAAGQIIYGPISDAVGRRRPIFAGLGLFAAGCVWAAFAPSIGTLIAARFVQGLGAAATAVVPMAVISDEHTGPDAARLLSIAILSLSVSPILAPTVGGLLAQFVTWRLIFGVLTVISLLAVAMTARLLPETLPAGRRMRTGPVRMVVTYGRLVCDRRFIVPLATAGCGQSVLLVFISGSPFVFVTLLGLRPILYGALFAVHAAALIGISQFNAPMIRYFGTRRLVLGASLVLVTAGVALAGIVMAGMTMLWPIVALTLTMFTCLGMILAPAFLAAMEPFAAMAGSAAALGVALELCLSSFATFVLGVTADGSARPMALVMAVAGCGVVAGAVLMGSRSRKEAFLF